MPKCDQGVATLIRDLKDRGLLDSTLVVLVGEFGRTPASARERAHRPRSLAQLLLCHGRRRRHPRRPGLRLQRLAGGLRCHRPVTLEDFTATMLHTLGIDPTTRLSPDGFSRPASTVKWSTNFWPETQ